MLDTADIFLEGRRSLQDQRGGRAWWQTLSARWLCERSKEARKPGRWREGTRAAQSQDSPSELHIAPCLSWYGFETSTLASKAHPHFPRQGCYFFLFNSSFFCLQSSLIPLLFPHMDGAHQLWCLLNYNLLPPHAMWWPVLKEMGLLQLSCFPTLLCLMAREKVRIGGILI